MNDAHPGFSDLYQRLNGTAYLIPRREPFFLNPSNSTGDIIYQLTGFTGSSAHILVTSERIFLYVDSRYTQQAQTESPKCTVVTCWDVLSALPDALTPGTHLILSPWAYSALDMQRYIAAAKTQSWSIVQDHERLLDHLFDLQSVPTCQTIYSLDCGFSFQEKCQAVFTNPDEHAWLLCKATDISWLTNLRGRDHVYAPFFDAFLFVTKTKDALSGSLSFSGNLFIEKIRPIKALSPDISIMDWSTLGMQQNRGQATDETRETAPECATDTSTPPSTQSSTHPLDQPLIYDPKTTPSGLVRDSWIAGSFAPLERCRSIKNPWEQHHMVQAHISDGVALTRFLHWVSQWNAQSKETEWSAAEQLATFRSEQQAYKGPSFKTISAMGANSAMMHYTPSPDACAVLREGVYLVDSGGQYHFGTTDVTRTLWLGNPLASSLKLKQGYTQVLQGHIHLSQMIFPKNTNGMQLDAIARSFLWQKGLDYAHSTGHGVGCFAHVHEAPPVISTRSPLDPIQENMIFSIEPGYYEENWGGIRLENLVMVVPHKDHRELLSLQPLTLAPFDRNLILSDNLSKAHRDWLNAYHQKVYNTLVNLLPLETQKWLWVQTRPL